MTIKVTYYFRKKRDGYYSLENLFINLIKELGHNIIPKIYQSKFYSRGFWQRFFISIDSIFHQGNLNHITGDINFAVIFLKKRKTIVTIPDCIMMEKLPFLKKKVFQIFWLWIPVKKSIAVTVISESTKRQVIKYTGCKEDKINVIYPSISDNFKESPKKINKKNPIFLLMGTAWNKNIERILEAIKGINCTVIIVGKLTDNIKKKSEILKIDIENYKDLKEEEIIKLYVKCDILIFASLYEGFGMPIIEANKIGRPVITSTLTSMPEIANDAACLVNPYNINEIRDGINKILNDDSYAEMLIQNGYINAKRFNNKFIAEQYFLLYKRILSNNKNVN